MVQPHTSTRDKDTPYQNYNPVTEDEEERLK